MENVCRHVVLARVVRSLTADKPKKYTLSRNIHVGINRYALDIIYKLLFKIAKKQGSDHSNIQSFHEIHADEMKGELVDIKDNPRERLCYRKAIKNLIDYVSTREGLGLRSIWLKASYSEKVVDIFQSHLEFKIVQTIREAIEDKGQSPKSFRLPATYA